MAVGQKKKRLEDSFTKCIKHIQPGMRTLSQKHSDWENSLALKVFGPILSAGKSEAGLFPEFAARGMSELIPTAETFQQNQCYESFPLEEHGEFLRSWIFPLYS